MQNSQLTKMKTTVENFCELCDGTGKETMSCCGDDIRGTLYQDMGICPTCKEHLGGECEECKGTGFKI